jgi:hypothetical protein
MKKTLQEEIADLAALPARALEARHEALFGRKPETNHRQFLFRKIAWRIQADREGGLSATTKELADAIAQEAPLRTRLIRNAAKRLAGLNPDQTAATVLPGGHDSRLPMPGGVIVKQFKGETLVVKVLADGFEFRDRHYKSLSAIALELTGTKWNGFVFFGIDKERNHGRR